MTDEALNQTNEIETQVEAQEAMPATSEEVSEAQVEVSTEEQDNEAAQ